MSFWRYQNPPFHIYIYMKTSISISKESTFHIYIYEKEHFCIKQVHFSYIYEKEHFDTSKSSLFIYVYIYMIMEEPVLAMNGKRASPVRTCPMNNSFRGAVWFQCHCLTQSLATMGRPKAPHDSSHRIPAFSAFLFHTLCS